MFLYIVRHGDPDYATDSLTERGIAQAEAVSHRLAASGINRVFSSPMGRARQTAEPTCRLLGLEMNIEDWAHEIGNEDLYTPFPDGVPKSITNVQNTYYRENGNLFRSYDDTYGCPGIDQANMRGPVEKIERCGYEFLERLGYKYNGENFEIIKPNEEKIALFCHSAMARAWLSVLFHIPLHVVWASFAYAHTGVTVLEFKNNENGLTAPKCMCYSDMAHLFAAGLDMKHNNHGEI